MAPLALLLLPLAVSGFVIPSNHKANNPSYSLKKTKVKPWKKPSADVVTDKYLKLTASGSKSRSSKFFENLRNSKHTKKSKGHKKLSPRQDGTLANTLGEEYTIDITFGTQNISVILDTGSSDTWVISKDFQCTDASGAAQSQSTCNFGQTYDGGFTQQISDENFQISYGDGEFVTGNMGYQDVTIAGITVPNQEVAIGTSAYWNGDSVTGGLVGLAYAGITSAYKGTDAASDSSSDRVAYDPIFTTMYKNDLSEPTFALALERNNGGYISFGGLPPVTFDETFASSPIQVLTGQTGQDGSSLTFYTITPDAAVYSGAASSQSSQYIVDSGTTLLYAPSSVAEAVAKLFVPAATNSGGEYVVDCNAEAPAVGYKIGGTTFTINAKDLVFNAGNGQCISGIQDGGSGPFILGDVFLNSVVAVFDVGAAEMRFAAHDY